MCGLSCTLLHCGWGISPLSSALALLLALRAWSKCKREPSPKGTEIVGEHTHQRLSPYTQAMPMGGIGVVLGGLVTLYPPYS